MSKKTRTPIPPLLSNKAYQQPAVFTPENLLREARRQKQIRKGSVPQICVLDPDGDIVAYLLREKRAYPDPFWACYHTVLYRFEVSGINCGVIGCAVGGPY